MDEQSRSGDELELVRAWLTAAEDDASATAAVVRDELARIRGDLRRLAVANEELGEQIAALIGPA